MTRARNQSEVRSQIGIRHLARYGTIRIERRIAPLGNAMRICIEVTSQCTRIRPSLAGVAVFVAAEECLGQVHINTPLVF